LSSAKTVKDISQKFSLMIAGMAITTGAGVAGISIPGHSAPAGRPAASALTNSPVMAAAAYALPGDGRQHGHGHRHHGRHGHRARRGPRRLARRLLRRFHWGHRQFPYLNRLWDRESGWNRYAGSPAGAYGIPQADPGTVMASAGPHWRWSARTQILWGLRYVRARYRSPRRAWAHECAYGWY
jgi:hypothetical protein